MAGAWDGWLAALRREAGSRLVTNAHARGLRVVVWTVNDPARMHRFLDLGVDGIITDRPDLLREVLISRDQWSAPQPART